MKSLFGCLLILMISAQAAHAATWRLEIDGSGDFTRIQDAINAAADGDTLLLGPGRFDDEVILDIPGYSGHLAQANFEGKSLLLIGSGTDQTIIGPAVPEGMGDNDPKGLVSWPYNSGRMALEDLRIENVRDGVNPSGGSFRAERCLFVGNRFALLLGTSDGAMVKDCRFESNETSFVGYFDTEDVRIEDCIVVDNTGSLLRTNSAGRFDFVRCTMSSVMGMMFDATDGSLTDCVVQLGENINIGTGMEVAFGGTVALANTIFRGGGGGLRPSHGGHITGSNVVIAGSVSYGIYILGGTIRLWDSHILSQGYTVLTTQCNGLPITHSDLSGNYWGYTTAEAIAESILDWNDDPSRCVIVDYEPFYPTPVEDEARSWGEVKSLFR